MTSWTPLFLVACSHHRPSAHSSPRPGPSRRLFALCLCKASSRSMLCLLFRLVIQVPAVTTRACLCNQHGMALPSFFTFICQRHESLQFTVWQVRCLAGSERDKTSLRHNYYTGDLKMKPGVFAKYPVRRDHDLACSTASQSRGLLRTVVSIIPKGGTPKDRSGAKHPCRPMPRA
jgi:hypothetical protein